MRSVAVRAAPNVPRVSWMVTSSIPGGASTEKDERPPAVAAAEESAEAAAPDAVESVLTRAVVPHPVLATHHGVVHQVLVEDAPDGDEEVVNAMQLKR